MRVWIGAVLLTVTVFCFAAEAWADEIAGKAMAKALCASCHAIAPDDPRPRPDAPPFVEIAQRYPPEALAETFAEGAMVGHEDMPEFEFSVEQIESLIAYFERLRAAE